MKKTSNALRWAILLVVMLWGMASFICLLSECHLPTTLFFAVKALCLGSLLLCGYATKRLLNAGLLPDEVYEY